MFSTEKGVCAFHTDEVMLSLSKVALSQGFFLGARMCHFVEAAKIASQEANFLSWD